MNYEFYQEPFSESQYDKKSIFFLNISIKKVKLNDIQSFKPKIPKEIKAHLSIFEFFLTCQNCDILFYSNNKFHKHLQTFCKGKT